MSQLHVINHPMIQHKLTIMRMKETGSKDFRELLKEIALLMGYEVLRDLPLTDIEIETPICKTMAKTISGRKLAIVPILRAGLGMVEGLQSLVPVAKVGHIGLYRNEETHKPVVYYCKLPKDIQKRTVIITDPMLATGGSACDALAMLKERGCTDVRLMCLVGAPEGIAKVQAEHPDVETKTPTSSRVWETPETASSEPSKTERLHPLMLQAGSDILPMVIETLVGTSLIERAPFRNERACFYIIEDLVESILHFVSSGVERRLQPQRTGMSGQAQKRLGISPLSQEQETIHPEIILHHGRNGRFGKLFSDILA